MRTDRDIVALVKAFEDCTLPKADWTHKEHLTVALFYLHHHERAEAVRNMRLAIQRFNNSKGNVTGYHETITIAWMTLIANFVARTDSDKSLALLTKELIEECGHPNYLLRHYTRERLFSDAARHGWLPPDLLALDASDD
jgi:hypothetical protein